LGGAKILGRDGDAPYWRGRSKNWESGIKFGYVDTFTSEII
jgi:hypothetical protein